MHAGYRLRDRNRLETGEKVLDERKPVGAPSSRRAVDPVQ
jgi:hypothetical protein